MTGQSYDVERSVTRRRAAVRVAVIGGGVSGLAAAHRLIELAAETNAAMQVAVFEAGPRLGGAICTKKIDEYLVEFGADSLITNKSAGVELCRRIGLESRLISTDPKYRQALVLRNGHPVRVPDGFMLMAPAKVWPVLTSPIFTPFGKLRMGLECMVPRRADDSDESVASFVRRRLGKEALERLVQPLVGGIYTSDPEKLSLRATLPRFVEMEQQHGSLLLAARRQSKSRNGADSGAGETPESGARYGLFASFREGMSELIDALAQSIRAAGEVHFNAPVYAIRKLPGADGGFSLSLADVAGAPQPRLEIFDAVLLALPADRAADLLTTVDGLLASALREIEYASSAIVATGHSLSDIAYPLDGSGLVVPAIERRQILSVSFASRKFPDRAPNGKVLLRTFVGGALQPEILDRSDEELVRIVQAELGEILGVRGTPDFSVVSRHERAMPQYHVGHVERIERIRRMLESHPRLALAGNAYEGVGVPDCIASGRQAAERLSPLLKG